ncbi:MAG: hypothetical protein AAFN78_00725 [Pseudomonadota bacterium]
MTRVSGIAAAAVALLLAACATGPAPVEAPEPAVAEPSSAVVSLLNEAQQARGRGDLGAASAHIERALRIDRRNPALYVELALIRFAGGEFGQAEALALKAASLAPADAAMQSRAWSVVARVREASGDSAGAAQAREIADAGGPP